MIYSDIAPTIGKTPLVKLNTITKGMKNTFIVKIESVNPTASVKSRAAFSMIDDAQKSYKLTKGMEIIESTSGNTGIAIAAIGRACGYDTSIVMPENMSEERKALIKGYGAKLILTDASLGMTGAVQKAKAMLAENPGKYFMPNQFENPANPAIHIITTGPEIDFEMDGKTDAVVSAVGSGGTVSGIGWYFKKIRKDNNIKIVAVEPAESDVITKTLMGAKPVHGAHKIQGIGAGFIPKTLSLDLLDHVVSVDSDTAIEYAKRLMGEEGISSGISGGAALAGAFTIAESLQWEKKNIVIILPDSGERYLSTELYR